jgi:glucan 1,3-beta-glucosidase
VIRGVNLGGWLVLEKWITPALFAGTSAEDEAHLWTELSDLGERELLRAHRDSFITERDFADLASRRIDAVRIPVPYFVFGDHQPYFGCIDHLDRAFAWAERHRIAVLLDLHTVPDSQNGLDGGGLCGVCKWHRSPEHVNLAVDVLEQLARRYRNHPGLWGIEVLNEPISVQMWDLIDVPKRYPPADPEYARGSEPVPTDFLKTFYEAAYRRIRAHAPTVRVVFHDGFRSAEWSGFFTDPALRRVAVDTHLYLMHRTMAVGEGDLDNYLATIASEFTRTVRQLARSVPVIVGEWSLDTSSPRAEEKPEAEKLIYYHALADAQVRAWRSAVGWFFWTYKLQTSTATADLWDLRQATDRDYLPRAVTGTQSR